MTLRRLYVLAFLGTLALLSDGCLYLEQPLSARADAKPDPRLVGTWRVDGPNKTTGKATLPDQKPSICCVTFDEHGIGHLQIIDQHPELKGSLGFFVTHTAKASYINALTFGDPGQPGEAKQYLFFKYSVSEDGRTLHLWMFKIPPFQRALQEGKLKGQFTKGDGHKAEVDTVVLQDSPEATLNFLDSLPDEKSFADEIIGTKVD